MDAAKRPVVITTIRGMREALGAERAAGRSIALTPTMGALHDGHRAHLERAAELANVRVVSIFVNPAQFGDPADLERYPRDLDGDRAILADARIDYLFAPSVEEMYPSGETETTVTAGSVGELYEGASRPGHFDGVLTVVAKLLDITTPNIATFGQKDAQQLFLVRRMVTDLNLPVRIESIDTVRESDGLALSSRNQFLDDDQRRAARVLSVALEAAVSSSDRGVDATIAAAQGALMGEQLVQLDYLKLVNPQTFIPVDDNHRGSAIMIVAGLVGTTRLIDNQPLYVG